MKKAILILSLLAFVSCKKNEYIEPYSSPKKINVTTVINGNFKTVHVDFPSRVDSVQVFVNSKYIETLRMNNTTITTKVMDTITIRIFNALQYKEKVL